MASADIVEVLNKLVEEKLSLQIEVPSKTAEEEAEEEHDMICGMYGFSDEVRQKFLFERKLGSGNFATVFLVKERANGELHAMKAVVKSRLIDKQKLENEIEALRRASHENIVAYRGTFEDETYKYVLVEYCPGGELLEALVEYGPFPEIVSARIMCEILKGVGYLHSIGVVHRDLKPENVLLMDARNPSKGVKITDFGVVSLFEEKPKARRKMMQSSCGTVHYMAPEILQGKMYDHSVDLWSCGVILYNLLSGDYPFDDESTLELMRKIIDAEFNFEHPGWKTVSGGAKNLITRLLKKEPLERLSANEALAHAFIKQLEVTFPDRRRTSYAAQ
eukprot:Opistho-2@57049